MRLPMFPHSLLLCSLLTQQDSPQRHPGSELSARVVCCLSFGSKLAKRQDAQGDAEEELEEGEEERRGVGGKGQADSVVAIVGNAYCITPTRRVASSRVSQRVRAQPDEEQWRGRGAASGSGSGYILAKCS